jgi:predicted ester cyclase
VAQDLEGIVRRFYAEVVGRKNFDLIDELLAPDFVEHQEFPGLAPTREGVKQFFQLWTQAFPDTKVDNELILVDGDLVAVYGTWTATHQGEFMGIQATGKQISLPNADFVRFRDGIGVEHWGVLDGGLLMQQLGVVPEPAGTTAG